jgi:hypothetical protein
MKRQTSLSAKPKPENSSQNCHAILSCINQGQDYEYDAYRHVLAAWSYYYTTLCTLVPENFTEEC